MAATAEDIVEAQLLLLRAMTYQELRSRLDRESHVGVTLPGGRLAILETQIFADDGSCNRRGSENLRVMIDIFDPERPNPPLAGTDFIRAPDGSFIDE
jgi:hypothetical protein